MNVTLSEIKKNLQGINNGVDEAKNQSVIWNTRKKKYSIRTARRKKVQKKQG